MSAPSGEERTLNAAAQVERDARCCRRLHSDTRARCGSVTVMVLVSSDSAPCAERARLHSRSGGTAPPLFRLVSEERLVDSTPSFKASTDFVRSLASEWSSSGSLGRMLLAEVAGLLALSTSPRCTTVNRSFAIVESQRDSWAEENSATASAERPLLSSWLVLGWSLWVSCPHPREDNCWGG